ncbi:MAG: glyoxylase-like metal-dependent hydrolase (beta-lactamase superfamily II) [Arenicella sp.]
MLDVTDLDRQHRYASFLSDKEGPARMNNLSTEFSPRPVLEYPFEMRWSPEPGTPFEVVDGVYWLRVPLPIALDHINLWILRDGDGWTLVDSGYDAQVCKDVWEKVFYGFLTPESVNKIIITHFHPDHIGLASWLALRCDCPILISEGEYRHYESIINRDPIEFKQEASAFVHEMGYSADMVEKFVGFMENDDKPVESRVQLSMCKFIQEGDLIDVDGRDWRVISGNGHSPEHACLYCEELNTMISGDQSIARISSNVSVYPSNRDKDPLGDWLQSCQKLRDSLPADTLMLPAHQEPFRGNIERMQQLIDDHHAQLNRLRLAVDAPISPVEARAVLFDRELNVIETLLATGETLAHLNYLMHRKEISLEYDSQGVARYSAG